jgi:hypothetical protein
MGHAAVAPVQQPLIDHSFFGTLAINDAPPAGDGADYWECPGSNGRLRVQLPAHLRGQTDQVAKAWEKGGPELRDVLFPPRRVSGLEDALRAAQSERVVWSPGQKPPVSAGFVFWVNIPPGGIGFWVSGDPADFLSSGLKEYIEKAVEAAIAAVTEGITGSPAVLTLKHLLGAGGVACEVKTREKQKRYIYVPADELSDSLRPAGPGTTRPFVRDLG